MVGSVPNPLLKIYCVGGCVMSWSKLIVVVRTCVSGLF